jgi:hypothetical protein
MAQRGKQFSDTIGYAPIPQPSNTEIVRVTQLVASYGDTDLLLRMLGLRADPEPVVEDVCRNGHPRSFMEMTNSGYRRCTLCRREQAKRHA